MKLSRAATALVLAGAALFASAVPALAHTELTGSTPAAGAALATPPTKVELTFEEPVSAVAGGLAITGPGGTRWTVGKPTVVDKTVSAPVTAETGPAGAYSLTWKVKASDGDEVTGKIDFTLTAAIPTSTTAPTASAAAPSTPVSTATAAPAADTSGGIPGWVWIIVAVVVLAVAVAFLVRSRRPKSEGPESEE
jgi:methionine-rich copper-binding protein CopC